MTKKSKRRDENIIIVRKKGKTVGRPSKTELLASSLFSWWYKKNEKRLEKEVITMILKGKLRTFPWKTNQTKSGE